MSTVLPLSSPSKKRKHRDDDAGPSLKKSKQERKHKNKHTDADVHTSEFTLVQASLVLSIPPIFASNLTQGVEEMLDSMVMRYIPTLRGVVLTHSNMRFLDSTAHIQGDSPFAVCTVGFDATVWSPRVGQRLTGKVNLCSPDHVSLLVHRTFNVSIPRHHIPKEHWVFEYGPAENDPEYGAGAIALGNVDKGEEDVTMEEGGTAPANTSGTAEDEAAAAEESQGHWVHVLTGLPLGGGGKLEFTVIGMTIANQMLSLVGSIQPDPFAPEHVAPAQDIDPTPADDLPPADELVPDDDSDLGSDIFAQLGLKTDRMAAEEARRRAEEERTNVKAKAEKKQKRKKDVEEGEKKRKRDGEGKEKTRKDNEDVREKKRKKVAVDEDKKPKKKKKQEDK